MVEFWSMPATASHPTAKFVRDIGSRFPLCPPKPAFKKPTFRFARYRLHVLYYVQATTPELIPCRGFIRIVRNDGLWSSTRQVWLSSSQWTGNGGPGLQCRTVSRTTCENTFSKRSQAQERKQSMGQWDAEAYDMWKRLVIPALQLKNFEGHLVKEDGWFKPTGTNTADGYWAYLLQALAICLAMKVVKWKPPPRGALAEEGGMIMQM